MRLSALSAAAVLALAAVAVRADVVVYDTTADTLDYIGQQTGQNYYYLGESVNPSVAGSQLSTISVYFGAASSGTAFTYTPDLTLDVYANANDALNHANALGSADVNNVSFTNDGVVDPQVGYNFEDGKLVTFNFLSQHIALPSSFVFAYHDNLTSGISDASQNFSVGLTTESPTTGSANLNAFDTYPNSVPASTLDYSYATGANGEPLHIIADVTAVPLPTSATAGLALIAMIGATTATKRLRRA
jgi:hypothetical protein